MDAVETSHRPPLQEFNLGELEAGKERAAQRVGAEDDDSPFGEHLDSAAGRMAFKGTERMAHGTSVELGVFPSAPAPPLRLPRGPVAARPRLRAPPSTLMLPCAPCICSATGQ